MTERAVTEGATIEGAVIARVAPLRSPLLERIGVRHGFSTRTGGVSDGVFSTLNLGALAGDDRDAVAENLRRFAGALDLDPRRIFQTSQVHGRGVRVIDPADDPSRVARVEADASVARVGAVAVGVRVADCVPVLVADDESGTVAAIHAGWKGVVAGVVAAAVSQLLGTRDRSRAGRLFVAIGPCIGACCFEVGGDVAAAIAHAVPAPGATVDATPPRPRVDLRAAVRGQLRALGVDDAKIDDVGGCTRCDSARFFSFRRDGVRSGRHLAVIAPRAL